MKGQYGKAVRVVGLGWIVCLCLALPAWGYDSGVTVRTVLKAKTTSSGQPVKYLKTDRPEITVAVVEIAPGAETGWHLHKIPVYAYVLEGTLKVILDGGTERTFEKGQAIIEVMDLAHNGINPGREPLKLIVFYAGEEGTPSATKISK